MNPAARIGESVDRIDTPALVVDLDALERNIEKMAAYAARHGLKLRPHAKTHKSGHVAALQMAAGAAGVCVQKVSEAQALADAGVGDIYITNEVLAPAKLDALARLALRVNLSVAVDSVLGIERLARAVEAVRAQVNVFVELDVGHGRCGVSPSIAVALAHKVAGGTGLRFSGLQAYRGDAQHMRAASERQAAISAAAAEARATQAAIVKSGLACPLISGGGTGTFPLEAAGGVYGELQSGSYVFMDRDYADNEPLPGSPVFEQALFVKSQVISRSGDRAVLDAGHKSHAIDTGLPSVWMMDLEYVNGGDEHGILFARGDPLPELGSAVWLIPGHCDPTVNLHDSYVVVRGGLLSGSVADIWPIHARGCIR